MGTVERSGIVRGLTGGVGMNQWSIEDSKGSENSLYEIIIMGTYN